VLTCDDDVLIPLEDLESGFRAWKENKDRLVGWFTRAHARRASASSTPPPTEDFSSSSSTNDDVSEWVYVVSPSGGQYSMIITKAVFMNADYLLLYTCLVPEHVHNYVDSQMNCEDIALNFMVAGLTRQPPLALQLMQPDRKVQDFGTHDGLSVRENHLTRRSACIDEFMRIFEGDPLVYTSFAAAPYIRSPPFEKKNFSELPSSPLLIPNAVTKKMLKGQTQRKAKVLEKMHIEEHEEKQYDTEATKQDDEEEARSTNLNKKILGKHRRRYFDEG